MQWSDIYPLVKRKHRACYLKLYTFLHDIEVKSIAEIGVWRGKNAKVLRQMFPEAHLYLIDPWKLSPEYLSHGGAISKTPEDFERAYKEVRELFHNDPKVTFLRMPSHEAALAISEKLDIVFIDANHDYSQVKRDILLWGHRVRQGGILSGHNYGHKRMQGVTHAVHELLGNDFCVGQDQVWLYRMPRLESSS